MQVNLQHPSGTGKILKMQIGSNIYFTETSKHLHLLAWKGKGYFFPRISHNSILLLCLLQEVNGLQETLGICRVHLLSLNTEEVGNVQQFSDYLRAENL